MILETSKAYRGELLGLMAVHLLLLPVNKVKPGLTGYITVYSDCEQALRSIASLPTLKIPKQYKHLDILKIYWSTAQTSVFTLTTSTHWLIKMMEKRFHTLSCPAQLNCVVDAGAKQQLLDLDLAGSPRQH